VWRSDGEAFGETAPTQTVPSGAYPVIVNLRNPGQYFDQETGLFYNRARYYNPQSGRYITSDPIGLGGGLNTYAYVRGNPLGGVDASGLCGSVDCNTVLPDGSTVGDVVRQLTAQLQANYDDALQAQIAGGGDPLSSVAAGFLAIAQPNGPIDFKKNFRGQASATTLGQAGNFAYYAIGTNFLPNAVLDAGASAYSIFTGRGAGIDNSANSVRNAALAAGGCPQ
jgi:RHS repeat-associated protein